MLVLALETSERIGSVALLNVKNEEIVVLVSATLPSDQRSAQSLLPSLQEMFTSCDRRMEDLALVCVSTGPGSFTGLRIGVTVAKTLAYATGANLIGVPTLSAIAASVAVGQQRLWSILDAQRQQLFTACFTDGGPVAAMSDPEVAVLGIDEWMSQLCEGDTVAGPPLKKLSTRLPSGIHIAEKYCWAPQAELVGRLGIAAYQSGKANDPMQLVPHYYRKSAAEEKADTAEQG